MRSRFYSLKMNLRQEKNEECFGPSSVPAAFARSQHTFSPQHPPPPPPLLSVLTQLNISKNSHKLGSPFTSSRKWSGNLARPEHKFSQVPQHMIARRLGNLTTKRPNQCPAGRVFQYRVGWGRVLDKILGSGSGSGRVVVSKNTVGYFRVSFLLSGISRYVGYFRAFLELFIYTRVIF